MMGRGSVAGAEKCESCKLGAMNFSCFGAFLVAAGACGLAGCMNAGPAVITHGRPLYADAIARTTDQQTLAAIVRMRYGESFGMLAVTSVTANINIRTNAQVQMGVGPDSNFTGNLVPLSGGVAYEENPTISYAPIEGPQYLREYLSPTPLEVVVLAARSARRPSFVLSLLLERVNGLWNPGSAAARAGDERFSRVVALMELLRARGELEWGETTTDDAFALVMLLPGGGSAEMKELISLLQVDVSSGSAGRIVLPLRLSSLEVTRDAIDVSTRSVFDLLQIAAGGVEVRQEDLDAGVAVAVWPHVGPAPLRVRWSASRPARAAVEVPYQGGWYSIDSTDHESKMAFNLIQALLTARTRSSVNDGRAAPVLTVPVSR